MMEMSYPAGHTYNSGCTPGAMSDSSWVMEGGNRTTNVQNILDHKSEDDLRRIRRQIEDCLRKSPAALRRVTLDLAQQGFITL